MTKRGRPRKEVKPFDEMKDEILEKIILHTLHPTKFPPTILTHEEISILWAKDANDVKTKMAICKTEQAVMLKLRSALLKMGITSVNDFSNSGSKRSFAAIRGSTDTPE